MEKGKKIVKSFIITFIILIVGVLVYNSLNVKKGVCFQWKIGEIFPQ